MSLADRVARLELKFARAIPETTSKDVPVLAITLRGDADSDVPYQIEHEGRQWVQRDGESVHGLHARASSDALASFTSQAEYPALILVARQCGRNACLREKTCAVTEQTEA